LQAAGLTVVGNNFIQQGKSDHAPVQIYLVFVVIQQQKWLSTLRVAAGLCRKEAGPCVLDFAVNPPWQTGARVTVATRDPADPLRTMMTRFSRGMGVSQ
jgi:hypothetical protein